MAETLMDHASTAWMDQVIIRFADASDLPAMEWDGEYTHFRRVYADAYRRQIAGLTLLWLAELPQTGLIGQAFVQLTCDRPELANGTERAYFYSFRVRSAYRGLGLGSRIMDVVETDLVKRHFQIVTLNVARTNFRAQTLYMRRGYYVVATDPGIWSYPDQNGIWHHMEEPAYRMEKRLVPVTPRKNPLN